MPFLSMISSCSMLFDSSKLSNLMLFLPCPVISAKSVKLLWFAILPCPFEHVLVISGDSSVFMFCYALPVHHAHAFCFHVEMLWHIFSDACKMPSCCFGQIVVISCLECMCCTVAPFWACSIWNLLRIACSFILSCCIPVLRCLLDVWMHFASMPCLTCFAHIF